MKYKQIFDQMYGGGAFDQGMGEASNIGRTTAGAEFAKSEYARRLKEAEEAAREARRRREAEEEYRLATGSTSDDLVSQFRKEKEDSNKTNLDLYYENESKKLNQGRSLAERPLEERWPGVIPSLRDNKKLSPWEKIKIFGG